MVQKLDVNVNELTTERTVSLIVDGEKVGYATFVENENRVRIIYVYVPEEHRSLGYGNRLVMFLVEESERQGVPLHTGRITGPGMHLFKAMADEGLVELEEIPDAGFLEYEVRRAQ